MQRLGMYPDEIVLSFSKAERIWIHAVSVGEVEAAAPIIHRLTSIFPDCTIILSTTTQTGHDYAESRNLNNTQCIYAPVDFIFSVRLALSSLKPDILVCMETELWPNLLITASRKGIPSVLVNGRISKKSFRGYKRVFSLFSKVLQGMNAFSMISKGDAERIEKLGADPNRIVVNGNSKFDALSGELNQLEQQRLKQIYGISDKETVFVAGSTRSGEEEFVIDTYRHIRKIKPDAVLIIAPRHVERSGNIAGLVKRSGFQYRFRTEIEKKNRGNVPVVIVDTMGELKGLYSFATVVFCGGSLVPKGGQNILEPAALGTPVFYGPHTDDFPDAVKLLEDAGGGIRVKNKDDLAKKIENYLNNPSVLSIAAKRARKSVLSNKGAADRHVDEIVKQLKSFD